MTAPLFSIITPVYDPPFDVLRETVGSVLAQNFDGWELSWSTTARRTLRCDRCWPSWRRPTRGSGHRAGDQRTHRGRVQRRGRGRAGEVHRPARPRRPAGRRRPLTDGPGDLEAPGGRLPVLRRGQGRRRGQLLRHVQQAGVVPRAPARPELHLPPVGAAHRARAIRRRLPRGLRRLPGPRPRAARHRTGPQGRPRPRGALPLAVGRRLDGRRRQRQALRGDRGREGGAGPPRPAGHRRGRSGRARCRASTRSPAASTPHAASRS